VTERTVRELLNRLRWDADEDAAAIEIDFVARGDAGERLEAVRFAAIVEILPAGVTLSGASFIPYHRIRCVRRGHEALWRAREKRGGDES
jgi:uncharacterized protein (UPF0248 family)